MTARAPAPGRNWVRPVVAGGVVLLSLGGSAAATAFDHAAGDGWDGLTLALLTGTIAVVGAMVVQAVPGNRVGPLLLATGAVLGLGEGVTEAGVYGVLHAPGSVPGAAYLAAVGPALRGVAWVLAVCAVPAVFPDGRLPGPRWRWLVPCTIAAAVALAGGNLLSPNGTDTRLEHWRTPLGLPSGAEGLTGFLSATGVLLGTTAMVAAVVGLVRRWRRDGAAVRQQLLLFALAAFPPVLVILVAIVTPWVLPRWVIGLAMLPLPLSIAVAMLGYGLYDLRRAAHRTLLWMTLSAVVVLVYGVVVLAAGELVPGSLGRWPAFLAAVAAALILMPLRDVLQRGVTRVVYGRWREPYQLLAGLGTRLEAAADVDGLLEATVRELRGSLDLRGAAIRDADGHVVAGGAAGEADGTAVRSLPLTAYGETVGRLSYQAPDQPLSPAEERLLRDLGRQLGAVLHARRLWSDLQHARERLVLAREEERRRLRRELHDGLGPALAGLTFKADTARALLPDPRATGRQLDGLRDELRRMVVDVRRVVEGLRPPALDELGLVGACDQAVRRLTESAGIAAEVRADDDALPPLPAAVEVAAYRIAVEAVTNVVRHAAAGRCCVAVHVEHAALVVSVTDDGAGLPEGDAAGHGLAIMRERAEELGGELTVVPGPPGTTVRARLPLGTGTPAGRRVLEGTAP